MTRYPKFKACAVHAAPAFLDAESTVEMACGLIAEAARAGAQLIALPDSFVPGFPVWASVQAPIKNHEYFKRLAANSVEVPGPEVAQLCALLNHHRKLVPTFYEKLIWANGDGDGLRVCDTPVGKLGMLICGENTNPLARYALIAQGEQVHVSSYPPVWPTRPANEPGRYDLASAIKIRAGAHSFEGKVFNIVSSGFLDQRTIRELDELDHEARETLEASPRAVSMILGPSGEILGDTLCESEGLLYQDIDIAQCVEPKQFHDVVGYYNRFDIFELKVTRKRLKPAAFLDEVAAQGGT